MPAKTKNPRAPSIGAQFFFCGPPRARREPVSPPSFSLTRLAADDAAVRTLSLAAGRAGGAAGLGAGAGFAAAGLPAGVGLLVGAGAGFGAGVLGVLGATFFATGGVAGAGALGA